MLSEQKAQKKRVTLNEMIYNDEYENYEDSLGYESVPEIKGEDGMTSGENGQNKPIDRKTQLPGESIEDPEIMKMLSDIRLAVINGLAKLANKPESNLYDCLKKVLVIIDKPIETNSKQ